MRPLLTALAAASLAWGADCSGTTTGLTPFSNPVAPAYNGQPVSLYPGGNRPPEPHLALGLRKAAEIVPRDDSGNPDPAGAIVFLSIGMSNTSQEFSAFVQASLADPARSPRVRPVDGAVGGMTPSRIAANPEQYWPRVEERLRASHVTSAQVQAAWLKQAEAGPTQGFPDYPRQLESGIQELIGQALERFPNLKIVYLSSRTYGGYASTRLNPEPFAWQSAFAVRWLIQRQIEGDPALDVASGKAPWLAWGPYLWADGLKPRSDGLTWECSDFTPSDGTHPSPAGRAKVARMLLDFVHSDPTARVWYTARPPAAAQPAIHAVVNAAGYGAALGAGSLATVFGANLAEDDASAGSFPLPRTLAGVRVEVDRFPALLYYVSPAQINFVVPEEGGSSVQVVRGEAASEAASASTGLRAPGLFSLDSAPDGPAAAVHADGTVVGPSHPARPGQAIQLFGTGIGFGLPAVDPAVLVGGAPAAVSYAGPAPGLPGLTQVNFVVPAAAPAGAAVPIVFRLAGTDSNAAALAVAP